MAVTSDDGVFVNWENDESFLPSDNPYPESHDFTWQLYVKTTQNTWEEELY